MILKCSLYLLHFDCFSHQDFFKLKRFEAYALQPLEDFLDYNENFLNEKAPGVDTIKDSVQKLENLYSRINLQFPENFNENNSDMNNSIN